MGKQLSGDVTHEVRNGAVCRITGGVVRRVRMIRLEGSHGGCKTVFSFEVGQDYVSLMEGPKVLEVFSVLSNGQIENFSTQAIEGQKKEGDHLVFDLV